MTNIANDPCFHDEEKARDYFERMRWPDGPHCPHCGSTSEKVARVQQTGKRTKRVPKGKTHRPARAGLLYCNGCQEQFTVRVGTVLENSHLPLTKWYGAFRLLCSSKKGISSHQLHRTLGVSYKSAWFLSHRIREAMRQGGLAPAMGAGGKAVEADETYIGQLEDVKKARGYRHKRTVLTLVERGGGARSFHIDKADKDTVLPIVRQNIAKEAKVFTDEGTQYRSLKKEYPTHQTVKHRDEEWVRGEVHTNTAESYFSVFKRGMRGIYQHCSEKHLHRYLAEFDFRYSNRVKLGVDDTQRTDRAVKGIVGKRLTYKRTHRAGLTTGSEEAPPF